MPTPEAPAKPVRLFKAVRELNVSVETLVHTLKESGFKLDKKLETGDVNAKLPADMYAALQDAFAEDMDARQRVARLRSRREREERAAAAAEAVAPAPSPAPPAPASGDGAPAPVQPTPEPEVQAPAPAPEPEVQALVAEQEPVAEKEAEAPVAPAEPVIQSPEPEAPVAPAEPVLRAEPQPEPASEPETALPVAVASAEEAPAQEAQAQPEVSAPAEPTGEPAPPAAPAEVARPAEGAPAQEAPDAETAPATEPQTAGGEGDPESVLRADRFTLTGTTVLGKIDLTGLESGSRRKRKRKKSDDEPAASTPADASAGEPKSKRAKKKAAQPKVDKTEAAATVQETLQKLQQGATRDRQKRRRERREERAAEREREQRDALAGERVLNVMEFVSTGELAELMGVGVTEVITAGFNLGMMVSINQRLDADAITLLADEFDFEVEFQTDVTLDEYEFDEDDPEDLVARAPIVTIMGHVDHGKTSLLDHIREANVVAGESGGITQHIGAYSVESEGGGMVTFLDTPGHEAFTAMRARGAQVTDVVILVVAADDQVMPQTREAINHAKAAGVPIVVALNKMDKPDTNPDRVMQQLADEGVLVEQYGGKIQCEFVSAKTGIGIPELLEKVLIEAELLELQANPNRLAVGSVIESQLDKGRGIVATVLVETGTLRVGDAFVAGQLSGRIRAMFDERDGRVEEAGPSKPVRILGFSAAPEVGDRFVVMEDEREAREVAQKRTQILREQTMRKKKHVSLDDISRRMALGELSYLNLILKADVAGSVEALADSLLKLSNEEVAVQIIHSGVGAINESDVMLAAASDAIIFGFQVRPVAGVRQIAEREEIDIRMYSVIYDAIEDVRDALEGLLEPEEKEKTLGMAEVRETFRAPRVGTIAGCYIVEGRIHRNDRVRLIRDGVVVFNGTLASLRRFKEDVREVQSGYECGMSIHNFNDIKVGDQIEAYEVYEERRTLAS
jgi:translation initiation factor IF-2